MEQERKLVVLSEMDASFLPICHYKLYQLPGFISMMLFHSFVRTEWVTWRLFDFGTLLNNSKLQSYWRSEDKCIVKVQQFDRESDKLAFTTPESLQRFLHLKVPLVPAVYWYVRGSIVGAIHCMNCLHIVSWYKRGLIGAKPQSKNLKSYQSPW